MTFCLFVSKIVQILGRMKMRKSKDLCWSKITINFESDQDHGHQKKFWISHLLIIMCLSRGLRSLSAFVFFGIVSQFTTCYDSLEILM